MNDMKPMHSNIRPPHLRRSWLFTPGLDRARQVQALASRPDVLVADLAQFIIPSDRLIARQRVISLMSECKRQGTLAAVHINPLDYDGLTDLSKVIEGLPDLVLLPSADTPEQISALDEVLSRLEDEHDIAAGATEIVPTIGSACSLVNARAIMTASPRVRNALLAAEDLAISLGARRGRDAMELLYVRSRFLLESIASGCVPIDCPCTYPDLDILAPNLALATRLGYKAKCVVFLEHVEMVHLALTPGSEAIANARRIIDIWDRQNQPNYTRQSLEAIVRAPDANNARRVLEQHEAFSRWHSLGQSDSSCRSKPCTQAR